jgi:hypothetical protein
MEFLLRPTEFLPQGLRRFIVWFTAKILYHAMTHRMVQKKIFIPYDELPYGS